MKTMFEFEVFGIRIIVERPMTPGEKARQEFQRAHIEYVRMPNWLADHTRESIRRSGVN